MKTFVFNVETRGDNLIISIVEDDMGIGYLTLKKDDHDLLPLISELINGFNRKYQEQPPQTKTGHYVSESGIALRAVQTTVK